MSLRSWNCGPDGAHVNSVHLQGNLLTQMVFHSLQTHCVLDLGNSDGQKYSACPDQLTLLIKMRTKPITAVATGGSWKFSTIGLGEVGVLGCSFQ